MDVAGVVFKGCQVVAGNPIFVILQDVTMTVREQNFLRELELQINSVRHERFTSPLVLGGSSGSAGGSVGVPGGIVGQLSQRYVAGDEDELRSSGSVASLLDNLNRIRYWETTQQSASAPSPTFAGQWWHNTSGSPAPSYYPLAIRNPADSDWVTVTTGLYTPPNTAQNGTIELVAGSNVTIAQSSGSFTISSTGGGGGVLLDDTNPQDVGATAAVGSSGSAAHGDHVHLGVTAVFTPGNPAASGYILLNPGANITIDQTDTLFTINSTGASSGSTFESPGDIPFVASSGSGLTTSHDKFVWDIANAQLRRGLGVTGAVGAAMPIPGISNWNINNDGSAIVSIALGGGSPAFGGYNFGGTVDSPSATLANKRISRFAGRGWGATGLAADYRGKLDILTVEDWDDSKQGTQFKFTSTIPGTTTAATVTLPNEVSGSIALGAGTLAVGSTNSYLSSGSHTHAVTSSSNPGVSASLIATDSSGSVQFQGVTLNQALVFSSVAQVSGEIRGAGNLKVGGANAASGGGTLYLYGGNGTAGNTVGGDIIIEPGSKSGSGTPGVVALVDPTSLKTAALSTVNLSDSRSYLFPDESGTLALGAGTSTVSTTNNVVTLAHTHAITSSSNPGAAASLLATDSSGSMTITGLNLTGSIKASNAIGARVYRSTSQSITSGSWNSISMDTERFDKDAIHSTSSNTSRLTCNTAGVYLIGGNVRIAANATGLRGVGIQLNGGNFIAIQYQTNNGASDSYLAVDAVYELAVNDYVELCARQESGISINVTAAVNYSPEFYMVRIA